MCRCRRSIRRPGRSRAEVSRTGYRETGRFTIADEGYNTWAHPAIAGGRLYIRNQNTLTSYVIAR